MLDISVLVYAGLLVLVIWRQICFYWCCGLWLSILNYMSLLYALLTAAFAYLVVGFYQAAQFPLDTSTYPGAKDVWSVWWLRPCVLIAPIVACLSMVMCWLLTESHVFEIHKRIATDKHDRAVQIIALPAVYGVMALASMLPVFELLAGRVDRLTAPWYDVRSAWLMQVGNVTVATGKASTPAHDSKQQDPSWADVETLAFWRYENCFYVGDLFEAWVLFQFGRLILEEVGESIANHGFKCPEVPEEDDEGSPQQLSLLERDLVDSHGAVKALTWVGTSLFVVLCVVQSACSLWPYLAGTSYDEDTVMFSLKVAGFVTSCAAIYNLVVVEQAFHRHLSPISPVMKFVTVKLLVSLSFFQSCVLALLQGANAMLPATTQNFLRYVPLLGDILSMSEVQSHLFYPTLAIFECFILTILHLFVWKANEGWYLEAGTEVERTPLIKDV